MNLKGGVRKDVCRLIVIIIFNYIGFIFIIRRIGVMMGIIIKVILIKLRKKFRKNIMIIIRSMVLKMLLGMEFSILFMVLLLLRFWKIRLKRVVFIRIIKIIELILVVFVIIFCKILEFKVFLMLMISF